MRTVSRTAVFAALVAAAFLGVACQQAPAPEPEGAPAPTDEELLSTLLDDFEAAWASGDAAAVAALFAEDGDTLTAQGHSEGRAAVQEAYAQNFSGPFQGSKIDLETTNVRFLEPDVAVVDGTYEISGLKGPEGEDLGSATGQWTAIDVKTDSGWRIGCSRPMVPVPMPEA
jgi:uncharacterized protein (TIGR02246 family)